MRENGGQYTHAALWTVMAIAQLGNGDEAVELFHMLNPINHTRTPADVERYKVEPYVVAADVYTHPAHIGRGGWTWYTGSAAWMYRARARVDPRAQAPRARSFSRGAVHARDRGTASACAGGRAEPSTRSRVENPGRSAIAASRAPRSTASPVDPAAIPLVDDGAVHRVHVVMGEPTPGSWPPAITESLLSLGNRLKP